VRDIDSGTHVSHYRIERKLGAGGMGSVFLAKDLTLDRRVAIKFLSEQDDEKSRRRLLREAQAVAALDHECIAGVFEVGTDPTGGDFIVMQYVEGETLAARLRRGRMEPAEALSIAARVAEALVAAHRAGVIHRDLKPQNIILTPEGTPKLLDFGLATRTMTSEPEAETETAISITAHSVYGTPSYMSPEQVRSKPADARSDVFALGAVLYECLTGHRAFSGSSSADIFGQVLHVEPPPVSSIVPELGASHDALCARFLKKNPNERCQSAAEALGAIHALMDTASLESSQSAAYTARHSLKTRAWTGLTPRTKWLALAGAVVAIVGIASAWRWYRGDVLPTPPAQALRYYNLGVEALRDGTYAGARDRFNEALAVFENYVQARSGVAKAYKELDDQNAATQALLRVNQLVPDRTRLRADDRLKLEGVLASVARTHETAIAAYAQLAKRHSDDPGAWLDLGLAEEQAFRFKDARAHFEKALTLDRRWPAAHVRLGSLQIKAGEKKAALASLDEAIRLYRVAGKVEGEAEALLQKAIAHNDTGEIAPAREALNQVVQLVGERYPSQRLRARFELARAAARQGRPDELVVATEALVSEAKTAGLNTIAANGLIDFANLYVRRGDPERAEKELARAAQIAADNGARYTEMRAQLQRAFLRVDAKPEEALALAAAPLKFYSGGESPTLEATAKIAVSRAKEALGDLPEAIRLSTEALGFADANGDEAMETDALVSLGPQLEAVGRLPDAIQIYGRSAAIYRRTDTIPDLAFSLLRQSELLIVLGRGKEAEAPVNEIEANIKSGADVDARRPRRVARLRAFHAATEGRFGDVRSYAGQARIEQGGKPDTNHLYAQVLGEYAEAQSGRSRSTAATLTGWIKQGSSLGVRCELAYWAAQTLRSRGEPGAATDVAKSALTDCASLQSLELRWRLAALAQIGATMPPRSAEDEIQKLRTVWQGYDATAYLSRADLKALLGKTK
jgi:tetratricopeptide (TPR) repeat protein/tRNA A-37 threonylcarbamoyl transferase component Bud32